jgi:putative transposase
MPALRPLGSVLPNFWSRCRDARQRCSLDLTSVRLLPSGERQTIFGLIDQGSHAVLRLQVIPHKCTWTLLANLCLAITEHGRPRAIRTDNEGMFAGGLWAWAFKLADIRHERIAPKCPWLKECLA